MHGHGERGVVDAQRVGDVRTPVELVDVNRFEALDLGFLDRLHKLRRDLSVTLGNDLARLRVHDRTRERQADEEIARYVEAIDFRLLELTHVTRRDPASGLDDRLTLLVLDVERCDVASEAIWNQFQRVHLLTEVEDVVVEEHVEDLFGVETERAHEHRGRQLAATVDANEHLIFRIELEVEPGTAIRDHPRVVQQLARAVSLAAVVAEEHTR